MDASFWHDRWSRNHIGFHRDAPLPQLLSHWPALDLAPGAQVFVPLCGKSLDMVWLAEQGHRILGVELSALAVRQFFDERGLVPQLRSSAAGTHHVAGPYELIVGDAFALDATVLANCLAIYDRAALIALPPDLRRTYASTVWRRLPGACRGLLVTLEYPQAEKIGPPFSVGIDEVNELFDADWRIDEIERRDVLASEPGLVAEGITTLAAAVYRVERLG